MKLLKIHNISLLDFKLKYRNNSIYFIPDIGHKKLKENFNYIIRL